MKDENMTEQQKEYTALLMASYEIMECDDKIREYVNKKTKAEVKYKELKTAYYEKYPGEV